MDQVVAAASDSPELPVTGLRAVGMSGAQTHTNISEEAETPGCSPGVSRSRGLLSCDLQTSHDHEVVRQTLGDGTRPVKRGRLPAALHFHLVLSLRLHGLREGSGQAPCLPSASLSHELRYLPVIRRGR